MRNDAGKWSRAFTIAPIDKANPKSFESNIDRHIRDYSLCTFEMLDVLMEDKDDAKYKHATVYGAWHHTPLVKGDTVHRECFWSQLLESMTSTTN